MVTLQLKQIQKMKIAVIDLGTNTFNLLIADVDENLTYKILLNTKEGVKLGEGGINKKFITEAAFQRGIDAVGRHFERMNPYKVDRIVAFATSAIRDAANGKEFTDELKSRYSLMIQTISGDKEAELIYAGVKQTLSFRDKRFMILDIGGGSNEFIIANDEGILWKRSFKLGMARLIEKFNPSDPITSEEISYIEHYLTEELQDLFIHVTEYQPEIFIGASGSFDSFVALLVSEGLLSPKNGKSIHAMPLEIYTILHQKIIQSTKLERDQMSGLEPVRRDMIVLASIFVNLVLKRTGLTTMYQSGYSLKEGAVWEIARGRM
jgi:exopolyphosphatase/guanosine-5'-triphosphate,3'-diphosphate pyrophosphatase